MIVADLPRVELEQRLKPGLRIRIGPVVASISSSLPLVADGIALHYANHTIIPDQTFADFHVSVRRPAGLRGWIKPQVHFYFDNDPPFSPLPADQAFPMLEWGLNWCISTHCHRFLSIHAAVVERNGKALVLPAPPGSGKSTLCAALIHRGWRLLSDELALIDPAKGDLAPMPRPVSLKNESIDLIRAFAPQGVIGPVVQETVKGRVAHLQPPAEWVLRGAETARPAWVVLPRYEAGAPARLRETSRARTLMRLAENSFNYDLHGRRGFTTLAELVDRAECYEFSYSRLDEAVEAFLGLSERRQH